MPDPFRFPPSHSFITFQCPPTPAYYMFRPSHNPCPDHAHTIWQSLPVLRLSQAHHAARRIILALSAIPTTNYTQAPDCTGYNTEHQNSNLRRQRTPTPYANKPSSLLTVRDTTFRAHSKFDVILIVHRR